MWIKPSNKSRSYHKFLDCSEGRVSACSNHVLSKGVFDSYKVLPLGKKGCMECARKAIKGTVPRTRFN